METSSQSEELFTAALEVKDPAARTAFLDEACKGDAELRRTVEDLLETVTKADQFFARSSQAVLEVDDAVKPGSDLSEPNAEKPGTGIGPYKLLQRLGEGGCGVVYLAEQEKPVRRRVALKIIKLGMDTKSVIARFEAEQQALALMDHPNIARVLDAGVTDSGRPYFVMELVHGVRLTTYCNDNRLDIQQRLSLFVQVCHAIQHAHQKGIIHRDIKPSNILVTLHDGMAVPKVIDFGIAKAIEGRLTDQTLLTPHEHFIGTPAYMSPEQAEFRGLDVDTRSDIYSLGVLLYELLTGKTPFDQKELIASGLDEMRRTLRDREPQSPSRKVEGLGGEELTQTAAHRRVEAARLKSVLGGDLDWIVMKALEKDRRRRYETTNGLAADVKRYLDNEPVVASPPSRFYRLQKLVRRNRVTFAAGTIVVLTLVASSIVSTRLYLKERDTRRQAETAELQKLDLQREAEHLDQLRQSAEDKQKLLEAVSFFNAGQNEAADVLLGKILVAKPGAEHAGMYRTVGDWHAAEARWRQAADRFALLVQINQSAGTDTTLDDSRYASLLVELGNTAEYDRFRESLIARYAGTENPVIAERVVKACLLQPAGSELMRALSRYGEVAERSLAISSSNLDPMAVWRRYSLALMAYRQTNHALAVEACERVLEAEEQMQSRTASVQFLLAMAHARLGQQAQARSELATGRGVIERNFPSGKVVSQRWEGFWFDWLIARIHLKEAEAIVQ